MQEVSPGVWDVWSTGKDMAKVWTVDTTCNCPDADVQSGGKAPQGHCKHRLAVWLRRSANKDLNILEARMEGLQLPHTHTYECGHDAPCACYDHTCTTLQEESLCETCNASDHVLKLEDERRMREDTIFGTDEASQVDDVELCPQATPLPEAPLAPPAQYEIANPYTAPQLPPCEALSSLNLKAKRANCEAMWTLRSILPGAQGDADIIARLPRILEQLRQLGFHVTNE